MTISIIPSLKKLNWFLCISGLVLLCVWQWLHHREHYEPLLDKKTLEQTTNIIIYGLQYRQYDEHGTMTHFLETPKLHHIPKNDMHILVKPHLIIQNYNESPWEIRADEGRTESAVQIITLRHHVLITQHKDKEDTVLKTDHLTYYPQDKKASSDAELVMTQAGSQINSKGFIADLTTNRVQLLSNARGHYVKTAA